MNKIKFDPNDLTGMRKLMQNYGDDGIVRFGQNEHGERTAMSIFRDHITVRTSQDNDWFRLNTYWADGTIDETYTR